MTIRALFGDLLLRVSVSRIKKHVFYVFFVLFFVVLLGQKPMKASKKERKIRKMTQDHVYRPQIGPGIDLDRLRRDPNTFMDVILVFHLFV